MSRFAPLAVGLALGLTVATVAPSWSAGTTRAPRRPPIQDLLDQNQTRLGLPEATLEQAWALANGARDELDGYRADLRERRSELEALLDAKVVDAEALAAHVEGISSVESRLRLRELEVMLEIRALLTPEQVQLLKTLDASPPPPR